MARLTYVELRAVRLALIVGCLFGIGVTFAFFGVVWLPFSAIGLVLVVSATWFGDRGRVLDVTSWLTGMSGESQVRRALRELEPLGYVVLDDVDKGHGNVDHVVIGPTGAFAIETKNVGGRVRSEQGQLVLNGLAVPHERQVIHEAMWVRNRLGVPFVQALLVYPTALVEGDVIRRSRVTVVSLARLNAEITANRGSLDQREIEAYARQLAPLPSRQSSDHADRQA